MCGCVCVSHCKFSKCSLSKEMNNNSNLNKNQQLSNYWPPLMQNDAISFSSVRQQVVF